MCKQSFRIYERMIRLMENEIKQPGLYRSELEHDACGIGAIVSIGILHRKQNTLVSPEELLVEYMSHIPEQEYEEMYAMLNIEASRNISQDD